MGPSLSFPYNEALSSHSAGLPFVSRAADLEHISLKDYVTGLFQHHVADLEKNGLLPKGK